MDLLQFSEVTVLDKGFVRYITHSGDDLLVANAARVSFNKKKLEFDWEDARLVKYLASHNHWTPFAHPQITLHIKAPIFVRTQLFKHKVGFTENEISRRYVDFEPDFHFPTVWRSKPDKNRKQGSGENLADDISEECHLTNMESARVALNAYNLMLGKGAAPEQARMVLPQNMFTEWYWTGSLAAYSRMYSLRYDKNAQLETQEYASSISNIISTLYPVSWSVLTVGDLPDKWQDEVDKHKKK